MKFYCSQRFFQVRTYYEAEVYSSQPQGDEKPISVEEIEAFKKSGQIKRMQPIDDEAEAMVAGASLTAAETESGQGSGTAKKHFDKMTKAELVTLAEASGITGAKDMNKAQLIASLTAAETE